MIQSMKQSVKHAEAAIDPPADSTGQDPTGQYLQEQDPPKPAILTAYPPPAPVPR